MLDAQDGSGLRHLFAPDVGEPVLDALHVHRGIEDVAPLATGQSHHEHVVTRGGVARHGGGTLARLVVRVRVNGQKAVSGHALQSPRSPRVAPRRVCFHGAMSTPPSGPQSRPSGRYPDAHDPRRTRLILTVGLVVVVIAGLAIAWIGYQKFARQPVTGTSAGYQVVSDSTVEVQVTVTRTDPSRAVSCVVYAKDRDAAEVGRREFYVPPSNDSVIVVTSEVRTARPAAVGDVFGCGTDVPGYLDRS